MSDIDKIRREQIQAGENAVLRNLERKGLADLVSDDHFGNRKAIKAVPIPDAAPAVPGDTPRTDEIVAIASIEDRYVPLRNLARTLERDLARVTAELAACKKELLLAYEWIADEGPRKYINYACAQCVPRADPETLIPGYVCPYHKAIRRHQGGIMSERPNEDWYKEKIAMSKEYNIGPVVSEIDRKFKDWWNRPATAWLVEEQGYLPGDGRRTLEWDRNPNAAESHWKQTPLYTRAALLEYGQIVREECAKANWTDGAALSATVAQPVAWRIKIGDSDIWGYCDSESDADFYGNASGIRYVKEPLYAAIKEGS